MFKIQSAMRVLRIAISQTIKIIFVIYDSLSLETLLFSSKDWHILSVSITIYQRDRCFHTVSEWFGKPVYRPAPSPPVTRTSGCSPVYTSSPSTVVCWATYTWRAPPSSAPATGDGAPMFLNRRRQQYVTLSHCHRCLSIFPWTPG